MSEKDPKIILFPQPEQICTPNIRHDPNRMPHDLLRRLRNHIPIASLIRHLGLDHRMDGSLFRFRCPHCQGFHTGVKTETNLARCFDCLINFNPIDMVMVVKRVGFRESVSYLSDFSDFDPPQKQSIPDSAETGTRHSRTSVVRTAPSNDHARTADLEEEIRRLKRRIEELQQFVVHAMASGKKLT